VANFQDRQVQFFKVDHHGAVGNPQHSRSFGPVGCPCYVPQQGR
jgi:hypothetical protein